MGPKKDIVGLWKQATRKAGLRFAVSEHLAYSYLWWTVSHGSDATGPMAGVPYDGADPQWPISITSTRRNSCAGARRPAAQLADARLHSRGDRPTSPSQGLDRPAPTDLLYNDGGLIYPEVSYQLVSHLYNVSAKLHGGKVEAVYTSKGGPTATPARVSSTLSAGQREAGGQPMADGHLHWQLALQARPRIQNAQTGRRPALRHRQPQRQPDAELPAA